MRMRIFIVVSILFVSGSVLAEAYRWVDEDGLVHYTDKPRPGAERIELPSDNRVASRDRYAPSPTGPRSAGPQASDTDVFKFKYQSITVASPAAEETLWNIEGVLNVTLQLSPGLQTGHQVRAYFDGNPRMVQGTSFQIEEVYRGVHNLQVEVVDATGKLMIRSVTNRFYVQQNTIN